MCVMTFPLQKSILTVELCPADACLDNMEKISLEKLPPELPLAAPEPCTLERDFRGSLRFPKRDFRGSLRFPKRDFRGSLRFPKRDFRGSLRFPKRDFRGSLRFPKRDFRGSLCVPKWDFRGSLRFPKRDFPVPGNRGSHQGRRIPNVPSETVPPRLLHFQHRGALPFPLPELVPGQEIGLGSGG
ncbi:hypothetical protein DUI87_32882 [Hirundo rustica rustica]|uniref:Uncharacterized protein n=1 Tax=Hirundo rustica rustica TaxID=333673 RepID=A0A3M0IQE2_HIRRU|nr:hypothetical protein DUI87_32882 [Hirundo rustica rustica]